ncbi:uncharacterized protein LOC122264807 isoform X2 [Penaeus japonicus]|nr:uncharacterized protein LOC122264807 isoform X2 [Penaeus japonicus]XP_042889822.1 uncharacterized protein LOC122264807 isoform X2 [Penaeus japonicus]
MAAHTPKRLEIQALESFVFMVLRSTTMPFMMKLPLPQIDIEAEHVKPNNLDDIILNNDKSCTELYEKKKLMMEHLLKLKKWWERNEWLGNQDTEIRRQIKECFTTELELIDPECVFPLFRFLLQLIFSKKAGSTADAAEFPDHPKIHLELPRSACHHYCDILRSLKPFGIEEMSTQHIVFGNSEPWLIIIKNSPFLKKVHFRNNISEEVLISVGSHCNMIDTFVLEQVFGRMLVPIDCLYKTFFSGLDYKAVSEISKSQFCSKEISLSFPRLKWIDVGWKAYPQNTVTRYSLAEFVYNILYFYSNIVNVSWHSLRPFMPHIPSHIPEHCKYLTYNIRHVHFSGLMPWIQYHMSSLSNVSDRIISYFNELQHITLCNCVDIKTDVESAEEEAKFAEIWLPKFRCSSLTIHVPFTPPQDIRVGDILSIYSSLFQKIGKNLSALHFHLHVEISVRELCQLIILCPSLKLLELRMHESIHAQTGGDIVLKTLHSLESLSVTYASLSGTVYINTFIEKLIQASPNLKNLELVLEHAPCEWLMMLAINKLISGIHTLRLSFTAHPLITWRTQNARRRSIEASFYVPFIELLPHLEVLMLGLLPVDVFTQVRMIYHSSQLRIMARGSPYIGYIVLDS